MTNFGSKRLRFLDSEADYKENPDTESIILPQIDQRDIKFGYDSVLKTMKIQSQKS